MTTIKIPSNMETEIIKALKKIDGYHLSKTRTKNDAITDFIFNSVIGYIANIDKEQTKENYKANYDDSFYRDYVIDLRCTQAKIFEVLDTIRDKFNLSCEAVEGNVLDLLQKGEDI